MIVQVRDSFVQRKRPEASNLKNPGYSDLESAVFSSADTALRHCGDIGKQPGLALQDFCGRAEVPDAGRSDDTVDTATWTLSEARQQLELTSSLNLTLPGTMAFTPAESRPCMLSATMLAPAFAAS